MIRDKNIRALASGLILVLIFGSVTISSYIKENNGQKIKLSNNDTLTDEEEKGNGIDDDFEALNFVMAQLRTQEKVDTEIEKELASGGYTFEAPFVLLDPYNQSPLSALVAFTTEEPSKAKVYIKGKTEQADVRYIFEAYKTTHYIPVYGLYPGENNRISIFMENQAGIQKEKLVEIETEPLPVFLSNIILNTYNPLPDLYNPGFNLVSATHNKYVFDIDGHIRWFTPYGQNELQPLHYNQNGTYLSALGSYYQGHVIIAERTFLGKFMKIWYAPYGAHHDLEVMNNGNILGTGSSGSTVEDFIYEIDHITGGVANILDLKQVLPRTRLSANNEDWLHMNAVLWQDQDQSIIFSSKHQSAVVKMKWPSGELEWILADHEDWLAKYQQYLLQPVSGGVEWPSYQHAPVVLPDMDGDQDTVDILLFDNGNHRIQRNEELQRQIRNNETIEPENYSRMVHYRINEKEKTIETVWEYGKDRGKSLYSSWRSSARGLENGNYLGAFSMRNKNGDTHVTSCVFTEVSKDMDIVWEVYAAGNQEASSYDCYRMERIPLYSDEVDSFTLNIPIVNLVPENILEQFGYGSNEN